MPDFARPFRLHRPGGQVVCGAQFPSGRVAIDDCVGFYTAVSVDDLLAGEPTDSRIEWADGEEGSDA